MWRASACPISAVRSNRPDEGLDNFKIAPPTRTAGSHTGSLMREPFGAGYERSVRSAYGKGVFATQVFQPVPIYPEKRLTLDKIYAGPGAGHRYK